MKKVLLSLAAVAALGAAAAPAAAQPWRGDYDGGWRHSYGAPYRLTTPYVDGLDWKIVNAAREGRISWGEARELRAEVQDVKPIAWRVQTGEAGPRETARLRWIVSRVDDAVSRRGYVYDGEYNGYGDRRGAGDYRSDYWRR
jgi:hypothetical protein